MKKFKYGFNASKQERNTINRQINRMEKRGYIFVENIRAKIKTTKNLPEFLYSHSQYSPFTKSGGRVAWKVSGELGHKLEKASAKTKRESAEATKKGILKAETYVLQPASIGPIKRVAKMYGMTPGEVNRKASAHIRSAIYRSSRPLNEKMRKKDKHAKANFIKSMNTVTKYLPRKNAPKSMYKMMQAIRKKIRSMSHNEWILFLEYSDFRVNDMFSSNQVRIWANFGTLLKELGMDPKDYKEALNYISKYLSLGNDWYDELDD